MVLEDVTEFESTPEGRRITKLDQILLNGNNITMVRSVYGYSIIKQVAWNQSSLVPKIGNYNTKTLQLFPEII
jgi:LSM domain